MLVRCPRDTALPVLLTDALAIPAPVAPAEFALPGVPDERASVMALITELTKGVTGGEMDLGPWTLSLGLAPVPDLLFIYGVAVHRRRRRSLRTLFGGISDQMRLSHEDLYRAFQDAAQDARYVRLQSWHFVWQRWFLRVHCLAVPITNVVGCNLAAKLADARLAFDGGVVLGGELPGRPHGFEESQSFHLFTLRPTVWSRLEADAIRSAMEDPIPSTPPPASAASRTAANQGEAA